MFEASQHRPSSSMQMFQYASACARRHTCRSGIWYGFSAIVVVDKLGITTSNEHELYIWMMTAIVFIKWPIARIDTVAVAPKLLRELHAEDHVCLHSVNTDHTQ